jgi:hypothetical protein
MLQKEMRSLKNSINHTVTPKIDGIFKMFASYHFVEKEGAGVVQDDNFKLPQLPLNELEQLYALEKDLKNEMFLAQLVSLIVWSFFFFFF